MRLAPLALAALALVAAALVGLASPAQAAGPLCDTRALAAALPRIRPESLLRARGPRAPQTSPTPHQPGDLREFWAWDLGVMPPGFRRVTAVCRVATDQAYVFVETALLDSGTVTEADVARLDTALHHRTPSDSLAPRRGILSIEHQHLGPPPDTLDGDPRVFFLVLRMDEFNGAGFDGYFNAFDQLPEDEAWDQYQQHSNEIEMLYLNGGRGDVSSSYMRGVVAHEMSHLIEHGFDPEEQGWQGEAVAEGAMQLTGYFTDTAHVRRYASRPESPLVREQYADYGAGFLFTAWLQGRYGPSILGRILREPSHGVGSIEGVLAQMGHPTDFADLHAAWAQDTLLAGLGRPIRAYRHPALIVPQVKEKASLGADGGVVIGNLKPWGLHHWRLAPGGYTVARHGDARVYEVLPGRRPRLLCDGEEPSSLETLDEPRWLTVVGGSAPDYRLVVGSR